MDLVSFEELKQMGVPYSSKHLGRLTEAGLFPKPIKLGPARNSKKVWIRSELDAWLEQRMQMREPDTVAEPESSAPLYRSR